MMKAFKSLVRVQLLSFFGINQALHAKDPALRRKLLFGLVLGGIGVVVLLLLCGFYSFGIAMVLDTMDILPVLLALMAVAATIPTLTSSFYKTGNLLFAFGDYEMVFSLPVRTSIVVASRLALSYLMNLAFVLFLMVPAGIVYAGMAKPGAGFYVVYVLGIFIMPLLPLTVGAIISAVIAVISARFKRKNLMNIVLSLAAIVIIMVLSMQTNRIEQAFDEIAAFLPTLAGRIYPPAQWFMLAAAEGNMLAFGTFAAVSIVPFALFSLLLGAHYKRVYTWVASVGGHTAYKRKDVKAKSPVGALLAREWRRYFATPIYVVNTAVGPVLMVLAAGAFAFLSDQQLAALFDVPGFSSMMTSAAPVVLAGLCVLTCTTAVSISLEGKSLWLLRSLPVRTADIFFAKAMVNVLLLAPGIVISAVLVALKIRPTVVEAIFLVLLPLAYSFVIALVGLVANLFFPMMQWKNETMVVKRSMAVTVALFGGMLLLVPLIVGAMLFSGLIGQVTVFLLSTAFAVGVAALLWWYLCRAGAKKLARLEG